ITSFLRALSGPGRSLVQKSLAGLVGRAKMETTPSLDGVDFSKVRLPFRSTVAIRLRDGTAFRSSHRLPRGAAANGDISQVAQEKLAREFSDASQATVAWEQILALESHRLTD